MNMNNYYDDDDDISDDHLYQNHRKHNSNGSRDITGGALFTMTNK